MANLVNHGELVVVETEKGRWVGTAEFDADRVIVRSGRVGRPTLLKTASVTKITPVADSIE